MAKIDLSKLNMDELGALANDVQKRMTELKEEKRAEAMKRIHELAKEAGLTVDELVGTVSTTKKRRDTGTKSAPKYIDPNDPMNTWTGKGRAPNWFKEALEAGKTKEELLIA
ncbi:H-NS family nucleoid-associated regulatory protein [Thetidibacter halocola]|uniref:H-NS histone family protein n=1 Tax=Thetidibacter halocola TaxID=2827239 RepID=A0A8J7WH02_9RHOB|nr:H-NS histone family protein [Thetidibacter halocola]MBS0126657.1 H-NS histone family protein [Thetidibacter halocola]